MTRWVPIKGFEGRYLVSDDGRVMNDGTTKRKGNILKGGYNKNGYIRVGLIPKEGGQPKTFFIHQLVARAFIPNPNNYVCINHKDEDKTNNHVTNLEWCDIQYNNSYGTRKERIVAHRDWSKRWRQVARVKNGKVDKIYPCAKMAALDVIGNTKGQGNIRTVCNGANVHAKTAYGYAWKYVD